MECTYINVQCSMFSQRAVPFNHSFKINAHVFQVTAVNLYFEVTFLKDNSWNLVVPSGISRSKQVNTIGHLVSILLASPLFHSRWHTGVRYC